MSSMIGVETSAIDILVFAAMAAAIVFVASWSVSHRLRRWSEQPKYTFQARLKGVKLK